MQGKNKSQLEQLVNDYKKALDAYVTACPNDENNVTEAFNYQYTLMGACVTDTKAFEEINERNAKAEAEKSEDVEAVEVDETEEPTETVTPGTEAKTETVENGQVNRMPSGNGL